MNKMYWIFYHYVNGVKKYVTGYNGNTLSESSVIDDAHEYTDSQKQTVKDWLTNHGYELTENDSDQSSKFHAGTSPKPH